MPEKTVLSVGQCRPDQAAITQFLKANFDVEILVAALPAESLDCLRSASVDLVLINRKLDADYSDGMEILSAIKGDPQLSDVPVMLVSNFEEWQQKAVEAGAVQGFGKAQLNSPDVVERIRTALCAWLSQRNLSI